MKKALLLTTMLLSGPAFAAVEDSAQASAYACAKSIQIKTGVNAFEVVRMTHRTGGTGNFRIWLNDHNDNIGAYCETFHERVMRTYTKSSPWQATNMYKPTSEDLAAR